MSYWRKTFTLEKSIYTTKGNNYQFKVRKLVKLSIQYSKDELSIHDLKDSKFLNPRSLCVYWDTCASCQLTQADVVVIYTTKIKKIAIKIFFFIFSYLLISLSINLLIYRLIYIYEIDGREEGDMVKLLGEWKIMQPTSKCFVRTKVILLRLMNNAIVRQFVLYKSC